ncbi:AbiU2 domain-containing protein [Mangrovibacterium diazotrophicum]|uniref:HEPN AbiU2-like domain-containing protein n=1 Tax=Mangrovibacterium diazotrophicum TaxID=1261403 RepID=A0A419VY51_9BACT|nr:hypothetical protein [Mangrovibacterium diazotrophicum]RKD88155.1 hypothetical protein BC643_3298 [Mangrovibacterium diazotrophicum]
MPDYKINKTDKLLSENIRNRKEEMQLMFSRNLETHEQLLDLLFNGTNHANYNGFKDTKLIWNIAAFTITISYDLKVIGQDLMLAENEWQKRLHARHACLIIYESINDFFDLLGKEFKTLVAIKICNEEIEEELNKVRSELNSYKRKYFNKLKEIRNTSIAHRDNDSLKQINTIINLSWSDTIELVTNFDIILTDLGKIIQVIIYAGLDDFNELKN